VVGVPVALADTAFLVVVIVVVSGAACSGRDGGGGDGGPGTAAAQVQCVQVVAPRAVDVAGFGPRVSGGCRSL
jgi:hypothetical protein